MMKNIFKKVGKFLGGAFLISAMQLSPVQAADNSNAVEIFREAMTKNADENRILREDIYFVVPKLQSELEFIAQMKDNSLKASGSFNVWIVGDNGDSNELEIPFYVTQAEKDMQVYFEIDKKWKKFQFPTLAAKATDIIATPNAKETENFMDDVKDVVLLSENDKEYTMLVKLDGNKLADEVKAEAEKNPADNGTAEDKVLQDNFTKYLDSGFRNSEIWYTWTVNKQNWSTVALSLNLSNLVQQTAQAALNDETQNWGEFERNILETIAYFSETKAFTVFLNQDAAKKLEIPKKALKAETVLDLVETKK